MPVTLSAAKGLARRTQRSFAALRMTARAPLKPAHGKPSLQMSNVTREHLIYPSLDGILSQNHEADARNCAARSLRERCCMDKADVDFLVELATGFYALG